MKRLATILPILTVLVASPAYAAEHLMKINEVLLSDNGTGAIQYVELRDANGEPFPSGDYTLNVYDAAGAPVGSSALTIPAGPPNTVDWYVATNAADAFYGPDGDDELTVTLPADGQVCFQSGALKIHCLAWGCVTTLAGTAGITGRAESPPDGQSAQRNGDGTYFLGTPTPGETNLSGVAGDPCPSDPDAGVGGPPDAGAPPDSEPGTAPDAGDSGGDDEGGGGGGCCRVGGRGQAGGAVVLALMTLVGVRRRATRR